MYCLVIGRRFLWRAGFVLGSTVLVAIPAVLCPGKVAKPVAARVSEGICAGQGRVHTLTVFGPAGNSAPISYGEPHACSIHFAFQRPGLFFSRI